MKYQIFYSKESGRTLIRLPKNIALNILKKIEALALDPYVKNNNVKSLEGVDGFRLRVGNWRILYQINDDVLYIHILTIAPRGEVYK